MNTILDVLIIGLQNGAIYSLVALGLVLVYKASRILNFAHGEIGTTAAFIAYVFIVGGRIDSPTLDTGAALWWATIPAVAIGVLMGIGINSIVRRVGHSSAVTSLVGTVAIALLLVAMQLGIFQAQARRFPRFIEGAPCLRSDAGVCTRELTIGTVVVSWHTLVILFILGVAASLLALFFRTRPGVALLATAQDPFTAELQGVSVRAMTTLAWGVAGGLAAIAGILGAGVFNLLTPGLMLTTFLIPGFTAAVLGGMTSMLGAVTGGLVLGVTVAGANQVVQSLDLNVPGPPHIAVLLVLLLVLLVRPRGLFGKEA